MLNLDTHILIAFLQGSLTTAEQRVMQREPWGISTIVFWEMFSLVRLGRLRIDLEDPALNRDLSGLPAWPISMHVCRQLRQLDFRGDPADEIIAATSIAFDVPLLTRDTRILGSKVVPLALA